MSAVVLAALWGVVTGGIFAWLVGYNRGYHDGRDGKSPHFLVEVRRKR